MKPPISKRRRGSILIGLLWCLAFLSIVVIGVLHSATLDLTVVKNYGDQIQARYLALAGIEKAKALIYQEAQDRKRAEKNHTGELYNAPQQFREVALGRGTFSLLRQGRPDEGGGIVFGFTDEESLLNINTASAADLLKLPEMTQQTAAAIIDYRDEDSTVTPGGAESESYAQNKPPYVPRNGPFQTTREVLMVLGLPRELFLGEDVNQNGLLDPEEDDGPASDPPDNRDGILDAGWSGMITVNSSVMNISASGEDRINIQDADEMAWAGVSGISADLAKAIVAYRNQSNFESLADLLDVAAVSQQNQGGQPQRGGGPGRQAAGGGSPQTTGPKLINEDLLLNIADALSVGSEQNQAGVVNINTAGPEVLSCLPGLNKELAQAIVMYRQSNGYFSNIAWLLRVSGMTRDVFKQVAPRVTVRSETFRILSEGKVTSTGARQRVQAVIRLGASGFETLSYREDL